MALNDNSEQIKIGTGVAYLKILLNLQAHKKKNLNKCQ